MNIIERIEKQVEAGGTSAYFHIRSDDVRAVLRLVKAVQSIPRVEGDSLRFWFDTYGEHWHVMATALAALEAPCS